MTQQNKRTVKPFNRSTIQHALAFTLAEVLIVIGIIGVVAALTLPNLNHATGDKEKVTKVKKIYGALTEAFDRAQAIYGDFDTWFKDLGDEDFAEKNERFAKRITEFMKVSKDCGTDSGCFSSAPLLWGDGSEFKENYLSSLQSSNAYMVTLPDGISLRFLIVEDTSKIGIDIDGPNNGKNQIGNDIFDFVIFKDQLKASDGWDKTGAYKKDGDELGANSTVWVIENGNLDYLKCPDELNWETKTSCE